jgi:predicted AAA+ superfamily ATPase
VLLPAREGKQMFYKRHIKERLIELLNDFRIVYLAGPRRSGKSTLVRQVAEEMGMGYCTLDDPALRASALSDPRGRMICGKRGIPCQ